MLRTVSLALATLSAGLAAGQITTVQAVAPPTSSSSCPIDFSAQRSGGPTKMIVDSGTHKPVSQQVLLRFGNTTRHDIEQMSVTVHGLTGTPHVTPVVADNGEPSTRSTHAELKLALAAGGKGETSLRINGITSVRSVELKAVQYRDGSEWRASAARPCIIVPNGLMLVDGR